jgi:hypothetical protein
MISFAISALVLILKLHLGLFLLILGAYLLIMAVMVPMSMLNAIFGGLAASMSKTEEEIQKEREGAADFFKRLFARIFILGFVPGLIYGCCMFCKYVAN